MWQKLITTKADPVLTFQRMLLAAVMVPHGAQKAFGWFGGYGFHGTMEMFTDKMGIPAPFAALAIIAETIGVLFLFTGFLTRLAAFGIMMNMIVAIFMVHFSNGFFMNWGGQQAGEGFEYHILAITLAIVLMIRGGGAFSMDHSLQRNSWIK